MVHEYAMRTGFTSLRIIEGSAEATRRAGEEEVRELAGEAFRNTVSIVNDHRPELDRLAGPLLM